MLAGQFSDRPEIGRLRQQPHPLHQPGETTGEDDLEAASGKALDDARGRRLERHHERHRKAVALGHRSFDETRIDQLQPDAVPFAIEPQRLAEMDRSRLGGSVGGRARQAAIARQRGVDRDLALAARGHALGDGGGASHDTDEIDREDLLKGGDIDQARSVARGDAG